MVRVRAIVNPELLAWARKSSRFSLEEAAKKLRVPVERVMQWESGFDRPTIAQLRRMADIYKRPLAVFYLPEPPKGFDAMRISDFRTLPEAGEPEVSPQLALEIRRAHQRREVALFLASELAQIGPELPTHIGVGDDPEQVAGQVRDYLGIALEDQFSWLDPDVALKAWKTAIENVGILVFETERVPLEEMRGMSIGERPFPVIALNGKDWPRGKIFTLLHEFTHVLLSQGGICDLRDGPRVSAVADTTEIFCNHVAGAALVPKVALLRERLVAARPGQREWRDEEIWDLSKRFSVSTEMLLRRLVLIGAAREEFYRQKRKEFLAAYAEQRERRRRYLKDKGGHPPYYRMVLRSNGIRYTKLVLEAYHDRYITASDLSDYLNMRLKHLSAIWEAVLA